MNTETEGAGKVAGQAEERSKEAESEEETVEALNLSEVKQDEEEEIEEEPGSVEELKKKEGKVRGLFRKLFMD